MALIHSKQLNPRLTGSFTVSGSITGDSESTGSFGKLLGDASQLSNLPESFTAAEISGAFTTDSASFATRLDSRETFTTESFSDGTATLVSGSSVSTGSFGEVTATGMTVASLTEFSSSVATKFNSLDGDIIALSIALG